METTSNTLPNFADSIAYADEARLHDFGVDAPQAEPFAGVLIDEFQRIFAKTPSTATRPPPPKTRQPPLPPPTGWEFQPIVVIGQLHLVHPYWYTTFMKFEWDDAKRAANIRKHEQKTYFSGIQY